MALSSVASSESKEALARLVRAAVEGDLPELLRCLVRDLGVEINALLPTNRPGHLVSPLALAASLGKINTTQELLQLRANPALRDAEGLTALHVALKRGHVAVADALMSYVTCMCRQCGVAIVSVGLTFIQPSSSFSAGKRTSASPRPRLRDHQLGLLE